jgi:hypothetical protein
VAGQRIAHPFRKRLDVGRRTHLGQHVPDQLHLAEEVGAIELEKAPFDGHPDEVADGKQHRSRRPAEIQREPKGDRPAPHQTDSGVSST